MLTYQDYEKAIAAGDLTRFVEQVISEHQKSELYITAVDADAYDHQRNTTILTLVSEIKRRRKGKAPFKHEIKIPCNKFRRLNKQRCSYLLGNGVSFTRKEKRIDPQTGQLITVDLTKDALGSSFDADVMAWGYKALIHGVSFGYWTQENTDQGRRVRVINYKITEFAPLWDENTNALRAGVRFWRIAPEKPLFAELYTEQGIYNFKSETDAGSRLALTDPDPTPYILRTNRTEARGEWVVGAENYSRLPVIPMYGSDLHQSTLVGNKARIDAIDLVSSGFARDVRDVAKIHIATVDATGFDGTARNALTPYVQDVPYQASTAFLKQASEALYEDFGAVDVHTIGASTTNDHLEAAYQPLNEEVDEFEREVSTAIKAGLALMGIDDDPQYKRMKIINQKERTDMILSALNLIGRRKALEKLDWIDVDEVDEIEQDEFAQGLDRLKPRNPQTPADDGEKV